MIKKLIFCAPQELYQEIDKMILEINRYNSSYKLTGSLSKSKIVRVAIVEWLDRQRRALAILKEQSKANQTAEEMLRENGYI